jgi:hypothetical protein
MKFSTPKKEKKHTRVKEELYLSCKHAHSQTLTHHQTLTYMLFISCPFVLTFIDMGVVNGGPQHLLEFHKQRSNDNQK